MDKFFETIVSGMDNLVVVVNGKLKVLYTNPAVGKFFCRRLSDFEGLPLKKVLELSAGQWTVLSAEFTGTTKEPEESELREQRHEFSGRLEARDPLHAPADSEFLSSAPSVITLKNNLFNYQVFTTDLSGEEGPCRILVFSDLTREREFLDRMTQVENTANLRTLIAGISHEINNPLQSVHSFSEAMIVENDPGKLREYARKVSAGSERIGKIMSRVSGWVTHKCAGVRECVEVREALEMALSFVLLPYEPHQVDVEYDIVGDPVLMADPEEIKQIWINILNNAVQAMDGRGTLKISAHVVDIWVRVSIQDTGPGMNRETLRKIFNPFYTTKMQGEGTGLGLSITLRLVEKYGGRVEVDSREGRGTTVHISLPAA